MRLGGDWSLWQPTHWYDSQPEYLENITSPPPWCLNRFIVQRLCRAETLPELHCSLFSSPVCHPRQLVADLRAARSCILLVEWVCPSSCLPEGELHCSRLCNRLKAGGTRPETGSVLNLAQEDEAVLWQYVWLGGGWSSCNDFVRAGLLEVLFRGRGRWMLSLGKGGFSCPVYANTFSVLQIKGILPAGGSLCWGVGRQQPLGSVRVGDPSNPTSPRSFGRTTAAAGGDEICGWCKSKLLDGTVGHISVVGLVQFLLFPLSLSFSVSLSSLLSLPCFGHWSLMQLFHHMGHTVGTACSMCLSLLVFNWDAVLS